MVVQTRWQLTETALKAAAHNPNNTDYGRRQAAEKYAEMHETRTGEKVDVEAEYRIGNDQLEFSVYNRTFDLSRDVPQSRCFPILGESKMELRERALKAAAHNPNNTDAGRLAAAEKMATLHLARTGEEVIPEDEARVGNDDMDFIV